MSAITDLTIGRFSLLTPFQTTCTYSSRNFVGGIATDTYTDYSIPQCRTREVAVEDMPNSIDLSNVESKVLELWSNIIDAAGLPGVRKDDYWTDDRTGIEYTIVNVEKIFHDNCFVCLSVKRIV